MLHVAVIQRALPIGMVAGLFVLGILIWTLVEYTMHRCAFHYDQERLGKTPSFSWCTACTMTIRMMPAGWFAAEREYSSSIHLLRTFLAIFGHLAPTPFAGLLFGYLCYDMIHYATHHFPIKRGVWLWLKQYHMRHHYKDEHIGYGVKSPLWDYVFRTRTTEDAITAASQNRENSIAASK